MALEPLGCRNRRPAGQEELDSRENRATTHKLMLLSSIGRLKVDQFCPFVVWVYDASPVVERQG